MWLDEVSGLYHVRARTYDAATGRFLSRDPVAGVTGAPESMNPYVFCNSNSHVWVDPSGRITLMQLTVTVSIAAVLGGLGAAIPAIRGAQLCVQEGKQSRQEALRDVAGRFAVGAAVGAISAAITAGAAATAVEAVLLNVFLAALGSVITTQMDGNQPSGAMLATSASAALTSELVSGQVQGFVRTQMKFTETMVWAMYPTAEVAFRDGLLDVVPGARGSVFNGLKQVARQQMSAAPGWGLLVAIAFQATVATYETTTATCGLDDSHLQ